MDGARDKTDRGMETDRGTETDRLRREPGRLVAASAVTGVGSAVTVADSPAVSAATVADSADKSRSLTGKVSIQTKAKVAEAAAAIVDPVASRIPSAAQRFAMMRQAMDELTQSAESSLAKILDKSQVIRLKQIQLQLQGPGVVLREDMMEKLGIDESQIQMLQEIRSDHRDAQRENGRARRDIMQAVFAKATPSQNNGQNADDAANGGNGGNNANGNGRNGGRGNRGRPDPEVMKKVMADPQVQAQMEQMRAQDDKLENQFTVAINKILTPRQRALYKKMLGPPFDRSKMGGGGPWGGTRGNTATAKGGAAAGKTTTTTAKADSDDEADEATPAAKPAAPAPAKTKATTAPRRKSLRELRGSSDSNDQ